MKNSARGLLPHGNAGGLQIIQDRDVVRISRIRLAVHHHANRNARFPPTDEVIGITRIFHEPERHVDPDLFVVNETEQLGSAVLKSRVAQVFCKRLSMGSSNEKNTEENKAGAYAPKPVYIHRVQ